jgi:hypothetical protein
MLSLASLYKKKATRDTEELNPEFSICNQNVEPSTTYPLIMFLALF